MHLHPTLGTLLQETPTPLGSPWFPRRRATVGSYWGGGSYDRGNPVASVGHRFRHARDKTTAPLEHVALCRDAGSLTKPRGRCALCSTTSARTPTKTRAPSTYVNFSCVKPPRTSRSSIRGLGMRSSSSRWQPHLLTLVRWPERPSCNSVQGYLAHKKTPTPLRPPWDPRHRPTVGS